jgi:hypothetical protein
MKMLKFILIGLMTLFTMNSFAKTINVNYKDNNTFQLINTGDTINFTSDSSGVFTVSVNGSSVGNKTLSVASSKATIIKYIVVGNEKTFSITRLIPHGTLAPSVITWNFTGGTSESAGIEVHNIDIKLTAFPNPVTDLLFISASERILKVNIFSLNGDLVSSESFENKDLSIDFTNMSKGIYLVSVETLNGRKAIRIVK